MHFSPTIYLQNKLKNYANGFVIDGLFKGLKFHSIHFPFSIIAGTYEKELFKIIESFDNFYNLIDIGAGDGYYVAGLKRKFTHLKIFAFELIPERITNIKSNLILNQIPLDDIELLEGANTDNLNQLLSKLELDKTVIIMDVEGYENVLLNINEVAALKNCSILVEIHELFVPGLSLEIKKRFHNTHHLQIIKTTKRTIKDIDKPFNFLERLIFKKQLENLLDDGRATEMEWFYLKPLSNNYTKSS